MLNVKINLLGQYPGSYNLGGQNLGTQNAGSQKPEDFKILELKIREFKMLGALTSNSQSKPTFV